MSRFISALAAFLFLPAPAFALRVVSLHVEHDGKTILSGSRGDDGYVGPIAVWSYLRETPLRAAEDFSIEPDEDDPLHAVIRGKLVVKVRYGGEVETGELRLRRHRDREDHWFVDAAWVDRHAPRGDAAEEARQTQAARARHDAAREHYWSGTYLTLGMAGLTLLGFLMAAGGAVAGSGRWALAGLLLALVAGVLTVVWRFLDRPLFSDDERAFAWRVRSLWVAAACMAGAGLAYFLGRSIASPTASTNAGIREDNP